MQLVGVLHRRTGVSSDNSIVQGFKDKASMVMFAAQDPLKYLVGLLSLVSPLFFYTGHQILFNGL